MNTYLRPVSTLVICAYFWNYLSTYTDWHFIDGVDLIFHEAGHTIFSFCNEFIYILAGSAFQIILPLSIAVYFFMSQQKLSGSLCLLWVGQNVLNVSIYAGDAVAMQLPLLGGDSSIHDWHYILSTLLALQYTNKVASFLYIIGVLCIIIGSVLSMYYALQKEEGIQQFARSH